MHQSSVVVLLSAVPGLAALAAVAPVPRVIQGGMGARISSWKLARAVSSRGELGITSGTAMDIIMIRELQQGDPDGIWRRSLAAFPDQDMVKRAMDKFFIEGGKPDSKPFKPFMGPMYRTFSVQLPSTFFCCLKAFTKRLQKLLKF